MPSRTRTKAVVTGGAGFIGSHLVRRLLADGAKVTVIDDLSTGRSENIEGVPVTVVERDLARDAVTDVLEGVDVIFHLAAVPSVPRSVRDPVRSHQAAATATLKLLEAARESGVRTFVNSSSSSVYGDVASPPMRESMPTVPRSPYAVAKLAAEGYTRVFAQLHGMRTVSLRYFNVFGPRQDPTSAYAAAIPRFITAYLRRERPQVYGDGRQSRDFTYVDNVVEANLAAAAAPKLSGESVNIAAGNPRTVLDVLEAISKEFGYSLSPVHAPDRPGDIRDSHADLSVARSLLGYKTSVDFQTGLRRTVEYLREASTVGS
ncbi:MAG: NAD-dependent epimerase/dehydratase family protein [Chloroflexi bacterium]|nr:MAG: NAD-dependent epimerase/dehydratase family protein [Chloroflexota bacterium]